MRNNEERMHTGELYNSADPAILRDQVCYQDLAAEYNLTKPSESERRQELLRRMLGTCGEGVYIEAPFYANFGGHNCHFHDRVYANYGLTCVDDTTIEAGEDTMFGPHVTLITGTHPLLWEARAGGIQYNQPIHIGRHVWIGAGAIVLPGVSIGDETTIGAGSVVTHDIPSGVLAFGTPCRVVREIGQHDREFYGRGRRIPWDELPVLRALAYGTGADD